MRFLLAVPFALAAACGTEPSTSHEPIDVPPDAGSSSETSSLDAGTSGPRDGSTAALTACQEATQHSDLAWIQRNVFDVSCLTGCHSGANASSQMDLSSGRAWASLVNVPSNQESGWVRVVPGNSPSSFLMVKLQGEPGPALDAYMPWGQPTLCKEELDAIRRWIVAGAPQ